MKSKWSFSHLFTFESLVLMNRGGEEEEEEEEETMHGPHRTSFNRPVSLPIIMAIVGSSDD